MEGEARLQEGQGEDLSIGIGRTWYRNRHPTDTRLPVSGVHFLGVEFQFEVAVMVGKAALSGGRLRRVMFPNCCWVRESDWCPEFVTIHEEANHRVVHEDGFRETNSFPR